MVNNREKKTKKIVLPGGAGLVGQNLVGRLKENGYLNIIVIDKHQANIDILQRIHPDITIESADLAVPGHWQRHFKGADVVVMLQAQIGGNEYSQFVRNNIDSTRLILEEIHINKIQNLVHVSSSVVESKSSDFYTRTKKEQEKMVSENGIRCPILRPTLMFGWFDRKHLGWLARFMKKVPIFPIPGHGRYLRQPLYVGDFVNIIISCIENRIPNGIYNISGHEKINYIDMIHQIKSIIRANAIIIRVPYSIFYMMLLIWGAFDKNPPFTTQQLAALVAKDEFEVIDWPSIFGVKSTPFKVALNETFRDPRYSGVVLEF